MPFRGASERYRVKPGRPVDFAVHDSREKVLFDGAAGADHDLLMATLRGQLQELQKILYAQNRHRVLLVLQAMDTGGKDGCIKRVFAEIDPQGLRVWSFKKPTPEELAHDFLWRVHSKVPARGQIAIFNRSHYEDIVAVRVKRLFPEGVWQRRLRHVTDFEQMLADEGTTLIKVFLHISKAEQKRRLEERLANPLKHWKFHPDDLADRVYWDEFMHAYAEIIAATSTEDAPWFIVPADRKWYRNLCVANIVLDCLRGLAMQLPTIDWDPASIRIDD